MSEARPQRMGKNEFIALIAMLFSTIAFSVDALLPAFPFIETDFAPHATGRAHLLITVFMGGLAFGTLLAGPISDAFGRRNTMFFGAFLYISSGLVAWLSSNFEVVLFARLVQGIGAAGPRVVSLAIVRDLYEGRAMAQIVSFAMVLFTIVPTFAPAMGDVLSNLFGWRAIMLSFILFSVISTLWIWIRLDEPLAVQDRRPFRLHLLFAAAREIFAHPVVRIAILVQSISLGLIFGLIVSVQPIFDVVFDRGASFAYWFGGIALIASTSTSLANAVMVMRFGMRRLITLGMFGQTLAAALTLVLLTLYPAWAFPTFLLFQFLLIWLTGLCIGNLNALALEPMGHIAGFTASITGATATLIAALISSFVGDMFNGTPMPLIWASLTLSAMGVALMIYMNRVADSA